MNSSDNRQLAFIRRLSYLLDDAFLIPGTRFRIGLDPIIGLIPGIGDAFTSLISTYIVFAAMKMNISRWTLVRMIFNILVDSVIGIVPVAGDLFDAVWKSNEKNRILLEKNLANPQAKSADRWFIMGAMVVLIAILGATVYATIALIQWLISLI
ncbi:MAG: DUF4112 domain-containing protein [Chitinophagaceae bacterium]|nr:DUF4112 domain-containing protein [Oligoflexus sp.]